MNMFVTDLDHATNVAAYCDVHLNKMILEQSQLLSNAHRIHDGRYGMINDKNGNMVAYKHVLYHMGEHNNDLVLYKLSHQGHPCTKWISESVMNYKFGYDLLVAMHEEYYYRFSKHHASKRILLDLRHPPRNLRNVSMTKFCPVTDLPVDFDKVTDAYREVFNAKFVDWATTNRELKEGLPSKRKRKVSMVWTKRTMPFFIKPEVQEMIQCYG